MSRFGKLTSLGQRRDGSLERLLGKCTKQLPPPRHGPYIFSIALHTSYVQMVQYFSRQSNYSAQQAALDYRRYYREEIVRVLVEIRLTQSYGQFIAPTNSTRPRDFWKDSSVQVDGEKPLTPHASHGHSNSGCSRGGYPCALIGATTELEFLPTAFTSDSATVEVDPPEGDPVCVNFDRSSLR